MIQRLLLAVALLLAGPAMAAGGMVSAADPRAAEAGREILRAGGTAVDASIAMMLALTVVEPQSSGIGGGGFMLHRDARGGLVSYDGREAAPKAADMTWFFGPDGKPLPKGQAVPGGRSVGVPGNLRLAAMAHKAHGKLPWKALFQPAIRLARDGFRITPRLANAAGSDRHLDAWAKAYLLNADGTAKPAGTQLTNPTLAATLTAIAARGPDAFYAGENADAIVRTVNGATQNPSKMVPADITAYRAKARPVPCGVYRQWTICSMGPPSSGAVLVYQILKQLERFDMKALGRDDPRSWHLIAESMRLAYADRDMYTGDSDFVSVPMAGLLDPAYLARRSALISIDKAMPVAEAGMPAGAPPRIRAESREVPSTTHFVAIDGKGDVATYTSTVEGPFGSGLTTGGYFLNNELTDFELAPVKDGTLVANRVEGGKRPRSSMAPTLVFAPDGKLRIALGAAGGSTIPSQVAKALVGVLDWGLSAQEAIALPLVYAPGDTVLLERGTAAEQLAPALQIMGHKTAVAGMPLKANAIEVVNGQLKGAADPRSEGVALAE